MATPLLQLSELRVSYGNGPAPVEAVRGVDLELFAGEVLAVVGESGSGKSQTAMALMGLLGPGARRSGSLVLQGQSLDGLDESGWEQVRGRRIGLVSQHPGQALNPYLDIGRQMTQVLGRQRGLAGAAARAEAGRVLAEVGLPGDGRLLSSYPHQLSGGMQQRVVLALALLGEPAVLVADEPTTALDVTTQARVLALLRDLARQRGTAVLLITHDLSVVAGIADRIMVMYGGQVMERGPAGQVLTAPAHPYTRGLLACAPRLDSAPGRPLPSLEGQAPDAGHWPGGCPFHPRCPRAQVRCGQAGPALEPPTAAHRWACFYAGEPA